MIFRLTRKLSKKIGLPTLPAIPVDKYRNPLLDWSCHLFTAQRVQYIILTNTASLYSMVRYGSGMSNEKKFIQGVLSYMKEFMTIDGNKDIFEKYIEPDAEEVSFSKMTDRRVMGSMNDFMFQAKVHLIEGRRSPFDVSFLVNESPMSYLKYGRPEDAFKALGAKKRESVGNRRGANNVIYMRDIRPPSTKG